MMKLFFSCWDNGKINTERKFLTWLKECADRGAGEILINSIYSIKNTILLVIITKHLIKTKLSPSTQMVKLRLQKAQV